MWQSRSPGAMEVRVPNQTGRSDDIALTWARFLGPGVKRKMSSSVTRECSLFSKQLTTRTHRALFYFDLTDNAVIVQSEVFCSRFSYLEPTRPHVVDPEPRIGRGRPEQMRRTNPMIMEIRPCPPWLAASWARLVSCLRIFSQPISLVPLAGSVFAMCHQGSPNV